MPSYPPDPIEQLCDVMYWFIRRHQVPTQTVQEHTDALIQVWEEIPRTPSTDSLGAGPNVVGSEYRHTGPYTLLSYIISCRDEIPEAGSACDVSFLL